jgi:hypothetical protein
VLFTFAIVWAVGVLVPMAGVLLFSFIRAHAEGITFALTGGKDSPQPRRLST